MQFKPITKLLILLLILAPLLLPLHRSKAQSGVLIPSSAKDKPDASMLSLQSMNIDILIDNQHARVKVIQIFNNHTANILEGKYLFALPLSASISDFAIWEGDTRIPGVIFERRRANELYAQIKEPKIDPGLLQQDDEHGGSSAFSAKVFPIPAYGTKRVEMEYTEMLPIDNLSSHFTFPLKASFGEIQRAEELKIKLHVINDYPISDPIVRSNLYQMRTIKNEPHEFQAEFEAKKIELKEDLSFDYKINIPESRLSFIAYRAPEQISAYDLKDPSLANQNPDGYFQARAIFNQQASAASNGNVSKQNKNLILLLDTSLSMFGEKLTRAVEAIDLFLHGLTPNDQFNLILFNSQSFPLSDTPLSATPENIEKALNFIRNSTLGGGTNIRDALKRAVNLASTLPTSGRSIVLISDANPTVGTASIREISKIFGGIKDLKLFTFALGADANKSLLEEITEKSHGYFIQVRETEDISLQLKLFFDKLNRIGIDTIGLKIDEEVGAYHLYETQPPYCFDGSSLSYVGRYKNPKSQANIALLGKYGDEQIQLSRIVSFPEIDSSHQHLPRIWARARIDALLKEMNIDGEREDYIQEIVRLSHKYKLVTPYTAFLAAPRSLLRPRLIQPGDPVIRVKTDPSIKAVFAVLPFGETLPLHFIFSENVWETRFLAPSWMPDGTYRCRLLLTDKDGNGYEEEKTFVVDSHAPKLKASLSTYTLRAGEELDIKVSADSDVSRIVARMYGTQPVNLYWSAKERASVGKLRIPSTLAAGRYQITISAEDFAHNQSTIELDLSIL
jgi:Ca-activated chloride channel homolog